ncbi:MAG: hypothetical protein AABZ08_11545 [Planctomycetota bacterium]
MKSESLIGRTFSLAMLLSATIAVGSGCTPSAFAPTLSSTIPGLDLDRLREIQVDERLTNDEKREAIRTAAGAPNTPEGDRLVDFLLALNIP